MNGVLAALTAAFLQAAPGGTGSPCPSDLLVAAERAEDAGHLQEADAFHDDARRAGCEPDALAASVTRRAYATLAKDRGDRAEALLDRAATEWVRVEPDGESVARIFGTLGDLAYNRGDLEVAEARYRRALPYHERTQPEGERTAALLDRLGWVELMRANSVGAEQLLARALAILERLGDRTLVVARIHGALGAAMRMRDDYAGSEVELVKALDIQAELAPDSAALMRTLTDLAIVALDTQRVERADELARRARAIADKMGHESVTLAALTDTQGRIAWLRDDPEAALALLQEAADLIARLAPGSMSEAESAFALGWTNRERGRRAEAAHHFCRLIDLVEGNKLREGGTDAWRAALAERLGDYYSDCIDLLLELGRAPEAFLHLERSRARRFISLLGERDLRLGEETPAPLEAERRRIGHEYDRVQARLWDTRAEASAESVQRSAQELRQLREAGERVLAQIRERSPRLAALRFPEPFDLARAQAAIDPHSVLLSYTVQENSTILFAVSRTVVTSHRLPHGRRALAARVDDFRHAIEAGRSVPHANPQLLVQAQALYRDLIAPAGAAVAPARRLLICPDGPLHALPFAALVTNLTSRGRARYLAEDKTIHTALSITAFAELARRRRSQTSDRVVAFGDPQYPTPDALRPVGNDLNAGLRLAEERGLRLAPLPSTRAEVEGIRRLYPKATVWLGADAREEQVKALRGAVRYLHLACHGFLDETNPLDSALVLSLPAEGASPEGGDNGLLQAWEILESVRVDADLVTLSACSSGLGREVVGEGLQGLTRAFHHAGARSVLASLWAVSDESTADLMTHFYAALRGGAAKDQALAAAQRRLIRSRRFAHPFYWAAFQLAGDWR